MTEPNYYYTSGSFGTPEEVIQSQAAQIADLVTKEELSKRVVTAHRRLCDERAAKIKELTEEVARLTAEVNSQKRQISFLLSERKECKECGRGFDNGSVCGECLSERDADLLTRE